MDSLALVIALGALAWASFHLLTSSRQRNLPPGPRGLPIIGNILQLGSNPHQSLANLSNTHGPLMSLRLGSLYTVVVSSPEVAKQVLQQHDQALCNRTIASAAEVHDFHGNSVGFMPAAGNSRWKKLRKICKEHLFSSHRLDESQGLRLEKLAKLRRHLGDCAAAGRAVNVGEAFFTTSLNLMTSTLFSEEVASFESDVAQVLKDAVEGVVTTLGTPNVADYFPLVKYFDPQGIKKRSEFYMGKLIDLFGNMVDRRLESRGVHVDASGKTDLLGTLVSLGEEGRADMSIDDIKRLFLDLFLGETHTITSTAEWAMTELILNPEKMAKAKNEVRSVLAKNKQLDESDIARLPYLRTVIKETLRLHPPAPLLNPRKAEHEVQVNGYIIPKNAQIFVNVWAIARDSSIWRKPTSFEPERFFNSKIEYKGQDFELLPFGSGRRLCPGIPLADRMLPLMVVSFIHDFDWKLEPGVKLEDLDTTDKFGVSLCKAVPLVAIPVKV